MELCPWESAKYLIFSSNVPTLLYYSHFVAVIAALIFALVLFTKSRESLSAKLFLVDILLFIAWTVIDVLLWASNVPGLVLFYWSLQIILEILIYAVSLYFAYVFITKRDLAFKRKAAISILILPVIALLPTSMLLPGIDISYCNAIESNLVIVYTYAFEILFSIFILFFTLREIRRNTERRKEISFFAIGIIIFLLAFSSGNIIGSLTEDWVLAQAGLFGMPIFIAFLAYTIVKFKSFNVKLISTQVIVTVLWVLTFAILFIRKIENVRYIVIFTLVLFTILGYQLIRSVRREIEAREHIEKLAADLQKANTKLKLADIQKTEFISFATHQLRSPLTAIKGHASLILEGDLGPISQQLREVVETIFASIKTQITIVEDYLNVSRLELGTMQYKMADMDLKDFLKQIMDEQKVNIDAKGLKHSLSIDENQTYRIKADSDKFKQVVMNTIDNSVKYTKEGSIAVSLVKDAKKGVVRIEIKDTGVGIRPEVMPKLFQKFSRAPNASETNIHGTGLGLFIAKEIMTAHGGKIWAESEGEGKGSQFYIEIPEAK